MSFNAEELARQLGQLGRDLDSETDTLARLESEAVEAEGQFRKLEAEHEDICAREFLKADGSVDARKAEARIVAVPARLLAQEAALEWNRAKARLRIEQASIRALEKRIEIGRSLLSREKALISLAGNLGET